MRTWAGAGAGVGGGDVTGAGADAAGAGAVAAGGQAGAVATGFAGTGVATTSSSRWVRRNPPSDQETQDSERQYRPASMWIRCPPIENEYWRACAVELSSISKMKNENRFMGSSPPRVREAHS